MKKIFALLLCFAMLFTLCACGEENEEKKHSVDIEYYANLGSIPEGEFSLGEDPETLKDKLDEKQKESEDGHYHYNVQEGETEVLITDGGYEYYYKKALADKGIAYMVSYDDAYGFSIGTVSLDLKNALAGYEIKEETASVDNVFFFMGDFANTTLYTIEFEKNTVMFLFEDNALCATVIYSNDNWK